VLYGWAERVEGSCAFSPLPNICANILSRINPSTGVIMKEYSPAHEYADRPSTCASKLIS